MDGILNIYKEPGWTSFDVVAKLRRILKQKKIGHTGTLDPAAQGVLPVCVGKATKLCSFLTGDTKTYEAVLLLGTKTDTLDMEGQVLKTCPVECSKDEVIRCIKSFEGECEQIPPMYSAIKKDGKKLYELARQGITVQREARKIFLYELNIKKLDLPRVSFEIKCSKGTYIRTLCSDIGDALGCGGCMESLVRTQAGRFTADTAYRLSQIEELADSGEIESALVPMDAVFEDCPKVSAAREGDASVHNGGKIHKTLCACSGICDGEKVRMYDSKNDFIGIFEYSARSEMFRPVQMLYTAGAGN